VLGLAALDSVVVGLWAWLRPGDVFGWLRLPEAAWDHPRDRLLLWAVQGPIALVYALFLVILIWRPDRHGSLALAPLLGRLLGCGVWLFVSVSPRAALPEGPGLLLAAHDGFWSLVLAAFLVVWWRLRFAPAARNDKQEDNQ
jgi:hypothetical protein